MILWPLLFISYLFAQDSTFERYCFSSPKQMESVALRLKPILVPVDKLQKDGSCFTVQMPAHRRELIQAYVRRLDSNVSVDFSSAEIKRETCKLKVEKVKKTIKENSDLAVAKTINAEAADQAASTQETMSIQTMNEFELMVDQNSIKGLCRFITTERYEVTLQVKKEAKPLLPPVPAGTIVLINNLPAPSIQETSLLQTQLQLSRGNRIEIGSVVKALQDKDQGVDAANGIDREKSEGTSEEKVFLSLE